MKMESKVFEIRDRGTFFAMLAVRMASTDVAQRYLLMRSGYNPEDGMILLVDLPGGSGHSTCDPYDWGGRTKPVAHEYIQKNFDQLASGAVVDVEFILGEQPAPKPSERFTHG